MLAAFAQLATFHDYIRPELTDALAIKAGRHPTGEDPHANKFILTTPMLPAVPVPRSRDVI